MLLILTFESILTPQLLLQHFDLLCGLIGWFVLWWQESEDVTVPLSKNWPGLWKHVLLAQLTHLKLQTHLSIHSATTAELWRPLLGHDKRIPFFQLQWGKQWSQSHPSLVKTLKISIILDLLLCSLIIIKFVILYVHICANRYKSVITKIFQIHNQSMITW